MLSGKCPFRRSDCLKLDPDPHIAIDKATLAYDPPYPVKYFTPESIDIVKSLLTRNPLNRLGGREKGIQEIKDHQFFKYINWKSLKAMQVLENYY